jgi:hypothetical protein
MKPLLILFVGIVLLAGCSAKKQPKDSRQVVSTSTAEIHEAITLLTELREGRISNVIETLEFRLDTRVNILDDLKEREKATDEEVLPILRTVKSYRSRFPRQLESDLGIDVYSYRESITNAQNVLSRVN